MKPAVVAGLVLAAAVAPAPALGQETAAGPAPPNVVILMTDDQTVPDLDVMPQTRRFIGGAGVTFLRSYVSYPLCCPSRATYLTGQYAHNNGVLGLYRPIGGYGALDQDEYLPVWMRRAGYVTTHIGKYLNGYGDPWDAVVPAGWTEWYGLVDHSTYRMWGYRMNENGQIKRYGNVMGERQHRYYQTDVLARKATDFIRRRSPDEEPFFLSVAFVAPHHESGHTQHLTGHLVRSAPRHRGAFADLAYRTPRSYNEADMSDKPWFFQDWNGPITARRHAEIVTRYRERSESLLAVDEAVRSIIERLRSSGELDNTYVIFTSDNGFMQGEHRVQSGKMLPYDPSTRVPLLIRGPGLPRDRRTMALVGNIDLAPTVLDATPDTRAGLRLDGRSILPFARNVRLRSFRPLLHETGGQGSRGRRKKEEGARGLQTRVPAWRAVRTPRWLFVDYRGGQRELYDLRRDPAQLHSLSADPRYRTDLRSMRRTLGDLTNCAGRTCRKPAARAGR